MDHRSHQAHGLGDGGGCRADRPAAMAAVDIAPNGAIPQPSRASAPIGAPIRAARAEADAYLYEHPPPRPRSSARSMLTTSGINAAKDDEVGVALPRRRSGFESYGPSGRRSLDHVSSPMTGTSPGRGDEDDTRRSPQHLSSMISPGSTGVIAPRRRRRPGARVTVTPPARPPPTALFRPRREIIGRPATWRTMRRRPTCRRAPHPRHDIG